MKNLIVLLTLFGLSVSLSAQTRDFKDEAMDAARIGDYSRAVKRRLV